MLTKILIVKFRHLGIVDNPDQRKIHKEAIPHGGGLAMAIVFGIAGPIFEYSTNININILFLLLPIFFLITYISFLDDLKNIPVFPRLITHLICSSLAIFLFLYPKPLFHNEFSSSLDFILSIIAFAAFCNIYNFLDGIDGLTCLESVHLSLTILILCYLKYDIIFRADLVIVISIIILGCAAGFLLFNWPPAKIFLGDVGSIGFGFLIGLCLILISASSLHLFVASCIASLYYILDGGITILIRLVSGEKIWQPHLKHFFQKAIKKGLNNKQVLLRIMFCNFILMILSVLSLYYPTISIITALFTVGATLINFAKP